MSYHRYRHPEFLAAGLRLEGTPLNSMLKNKPEDGMTQAGNAKRPVLFVAG